MPVVMRAGSAVTTERDPPTSSRGAGRDELCSDLMGTTAPPHYRTTALKKRTGSAETLPALKKTPAAPYSPAREPRSTLGDGALHFRVRDGNGCFLPSRAAGKKAEANVRETVNDRVPGTLARTGRVRARSAPSGAHQGPLRLFS